MKSGNGKKIKVGKHINDIVLNDLGYLLDGPDGDILYFDSKLQAENYLGEAGYSDEDMEGLHFIEEED